MKFKHNNVVTLSKDDLHGYTNSSRHRPCVYFGDFYLPSAKKPFTGVLEITSDINPFNLRLSLISRVSFRHGLIHGLYERFYENGEVESKERYKDGKLHGLSSYPLDSERSYRSKFYSFLPRYYEFYINGIYVDRFWFWFLLFLLLVGLPYIFAYTLLHYSYFKITSRECSEQNCEYCDLSGLNSLKVLSSILNAS